MIRKLDTEEELRAKITAALVRDVGVSERMARPFVESILGCFAGQRLYFPAQEREYPVMLIRAALEAGEPARTVCRNYNISRRTLSRLFPGGLPIARKSGSGPS